MAKVVYTIGITGGSGSGKTRFVNELAKQFDASELCLISQDNYYKERQHQTIDERGVENYDLPEAIDIERFHQDIVTLKRGESVQKREYTFNNAATAPSTLEFKPAPILIVEGLFVQYFRPLEKELDLLVFIEAKDYLKLSRRIRRDNDERGYDLNDVLYRYQNHVMPVYESYIEPLKHKADLVIPNNQHFDRALDLITTALRAKLKGLDR
ncbi:MAG TPA: uridine kinase [Cyclobacteriaceae bacterium]|nr:uridine kinase [Cyclobacteriaceae bacterium]